MDNSAHTSRRARLLHSAGLLIAGVALCAAAPAFAQEEASSEDTIVVTGSRLINRGFDAPTPVSIIGQEEIQFSGTTNIENLLSASPQFAPSINGGATANTVPGGAANVSLRGEAFGPRRNLVLVNGRRFAIQGPDQTVDLNTIPAALVARTEIVTGGSSAVYGSDAITGVVNFIMRDDFEGVEAAYQHAWDSHTSTPVEDVNLSIGGSFDNDRGNIVLSVNYLNRGGITRGQRGDWTFFSNADGCVTASSWSEDMPGVPLPGVSLAGCRAAGGIPGIINSGSGDIPNGRYLGIPLPSAVVGTPLGAAYTAAGLGGMGAFGFTFNDAGSTARPAIDPDDRYNLGPENYLIVPQERWMMNAFSHYDFTDKITGYMEFHFSNNTVNQQLAPTNINQSVLLNVNNPYLSPAMQDVLRQLDLRETATVNVAAGPVNYVNAPNDGLAQITIGRRMVELGDRFNSAERVAWRFAGGFRGEIGDLHPEFLRELTYDAYYMYARTDETDHQTGNGARSRYQAAILRPTPGAAPVCNIFGQNMSSTCVAAFGIAATNITEAETQGAVGSISGVAFDNWAGPIDFVAGVEWRMSSAAYDPDTFLSSGDVVGFNPGRPTKGKESVKEVFGELRVPLITDVPLVERLTFNGAFRHSEYDLEGVGGVWTYSEGLEWEVSEDLTFRGQFQHAIRAPNVEELFGGRVTNFNSAVDPCGALQPTAQRTQATRDVCIATGVPAANVFTAAVQSPNGSLIGNTSGGNPDLSAEESDTFTIGAVIQPRFIPGLAVSVDYFNIKLDEAIAPLGAGLAGTLNFCYNVLQDASSVFCQAVARSATTGEIAPPNVVALTNTNIAGIETTGVDLAVSYSLDLDWGLFNHTSSLSFSSNATWTDELVSQPVQDLPDKSDCVGSFGQSCQQPVPEWKAVSRVTWNTGPLSLSLRHRYIGEVTDDRYTLPLQRGATPPALENMTNPIIDAQHYFDASFGYDFGERLRLYGGVNNVADEDPPVLGSAQTRANTWPATYDVLGRQFFLGATVQFH